MQSTKTFTNNRTPDKFINSIYEVKKTNRISFKKILSNEAIKARLAVAMKGQVHDSRNGMGYAI
jgi:hypothetical protein